LLLGPIARRPEVIAVSGRLPIARQGSIAHRLLVQTAQPAWGVVLELCILRMFASIVLLIRAFGLFSVKVERDPIRKLSPCFGSLASA
jgi:hypothetical protein